MPDIALIRTNEPMPEGNALDAVRQFLFGLFKGATDQDEKRWNRFWRMVASKEPGEMFSVETMFPRNPKFHKKMFALLSVGFDNWEPDRKRFSYGGRTIEKNFERFREQVLILAGHYDQVFSLRGDKMELVAKSISYAAMDDAEFETLYSAVIDVLLREVCTRYKGREELEAVAEQVMRFA
jgi:hypothetical protein